MSEESVSGGYRLSDPGGTGRGKPDPLGPLIGRLRAAGCVFAEAEAGLLAAEAENDAALEAMVERRTAGEPLEQILGWSEFFGLRVAVLPGVFVPRRRTELLASHTITVLTGRNDAVVAELCCGTGAVSLAIAEHFRNAEQSHNAGDSHGAGSSRIAALFAADLDPAAVRCARTNLAGRATVLQGDLFAALPPRLRGRLDVVVANAPYVPTGQLAAMPPEARDHEPPAALHGGTDGLDVLRRIITEAPAWLKPDGTLLLECGRGQAPLVTVLLTAAGFVPEIHHGDAPEATAAAGRRSPCTANTER